MPSSTNPHLIASSRTATAPYPPTIAGSSDTDDKVKKTCGCCRKVKSQAPKEIPPHPNREEFQVLKEKAEAGTKTTVGIPCGTEQSFRMFCLQRARIPATGGGLWPRALRQVHSDKERRSSAIQKADFVHCGNCGCYIVCEPMPCYPVQEYVLALAEAQSTAVPDQISNVWKCRSRPRQN
ncbi:hypothetical protein BT96DRAFT_992470 [Gymnopus androsaceus JB14]|uniref:Uncharacterized protein n=1 Tax=Gymnopus androsaceus JB14 TaxID=1447944 RepID=A0A6A4HQ15_9AGAR|nr:hypothetical protein BT96DRAFT_992470 [Gymnopus androsaceus JB14]